MPTNSPVGFFFAPLFVHTILSGSYGISEIQCIVTIDLEVWTASMHVMMNWSQTVIIRCTCGLGSMFDIKQKSITAARGQ